MIHEKENLFVNDYKTWGALFRNKRFMLDEMFQRNASKFAIFLEYENPCSFFHFVLLFFSLMNALVYIGIHWGEKNKVARNEKNKIATYVFVFQRYGKF